MDESTTDVLRWLKHLAPDTEVLRVNSDEPYRVDALELTGELITFTIDGQTYSASELTTIWYRKGGHWLCNVFLQVDESVPPHLKTYLAAKTKVEERRLSEYLHAQVEKHARCLGSARGALNKLLVLDVAASCGFAVPRFLVSTSAAGLAAELAHHRGVVTKPVSDGLYLFEYSAASSGYYSYTEKVSRETFDGLPPVISPSLVQAQIRKRVDVRVFYLDGACHSMAIFSQSDERTSVDFRRYNDERPNRTVPYQLPVEVEDRLRRLFCELGENTGSADLLLDESGEYVFLEINPVGQFGMVSEPCNYYLEREVATWLLDHEAR